MPLLQVENTNLFIIEVFNAVSKQGQYEKKPWHIHYPN